MATGRRCSATTGPRNTCLQEGSGLGLSHGLCVALATLWLIYHTLLFHPAASTSESS